MKYFCKNKEINCKKHNHDFPSDKQQHFGTVGEDFSALYKWREKKYIEDIKKFELENAKKIQLLKQKAKRLDLNIYIYYKP